MAKSDDEAAELRSSWIKMLVEQGVDPAFAERAYDCAHRIGRGAGRLEALKMVRETGSVIASCDAFSMLNEVEGMFMDVEP